MKTSKKITIVIVALLSLALFLFWYSKISNGVDTPTPTIINQEEPKAIGLANPASVNCKKEGGDLLIQTLPYGGQYGLCMFEDNRGCEEWALMRGECPKGGVKTTGYDTIDQKYCVWRGGVTRAEASSTCLFRNGKECLTKDYYNGKCNDI